MTQEDASRPAETPEERKKRVKKERRARRLSALAYTAATAIYRSLNLNVVNQEPTLPSGIGSIFVTWHGRTLIPANYFRNRSYWALVSLSNDGEMQSKIFEKYGFQIARGSTGRGGVKGALQMARKVKEGGVLAFTPDGPRGPTHKVQLGVILMAEKSGAPIIPVGVSASRRWLIKSWDSYMVPRPFSKAYWVYGDPIYVPNNLDEAARDHFAELVEIALNKVEKQAEELAGHKDYPAEWRTTLDAAETHSNPA
jgi:lysophospholipid acyltransferase (LPLAT)-like uncharacterized protein